MNLEEHNQKTWEGVSWMVKLFLAVFYGVLFGLILRALYAAI
jgi:tetrahydromethanopterin S-methyltransferase subunit B